MQHYSAHFTTRLLVEAGIRSGMRVLDIGCGLGEVTFLVASIVGATGTVIGADRSEAAIAMARQRVPDGIPVPIFIQADIDALPGELRLFDAIVGRRVLMYQSDPVKAVRSLTARLAPGGVIVFQEADMSMLPGRVVPLPLHEQILGWLRQMLVAEGANIEMGFRLHHVMTQAGLTVQGVRAEAIVQTPNQPNPLGAIVTAVWQRFVEHGIATAAEIDVDTIQARLDAERISTDATYIGDMMFGIWALDRYEPLPGR